MSDEPQDLESVERKAAVVRSVRQVMHALWAMSRAQAARAQNFRGDSVVYYQWLDDVVRRLSRPSATGAARARLTVLIGPERPLCGGLVRLLSESVPAARSFGVVGTHLRDSLPPDVRGLAFFHAGVAQAEELSSRAESLTRQILVHGVGLDIELLFPLGERGPVHRELLLQQGRLAQDLSFDVYTPGEALLSAALHHALTGRVAHALTQTLRAELGARIQTTERARQACEERLDELQASWRTLRQETITRELAEVVAAQLGTEEWGP